MTKSNKMSFELNQTQLNAAIVVAMPSLIRDLEINYTSGRPPAGLRADVTLTEAVIRAAAIDHAKRLVNPDFKHFSVSFRATRGEDGLITTIEASTDPIVPDEPETRTEASAPTTGEALAPTTEPAPEPVAQTAPTEQVQEAAQAVQESPEAVPAPEVTEEVVQTADVPFEDAAPATSEELAAVSPVEEVVAAAEEAPAAEAGTTEEAAKPTAGRSRLFGDLARPSN